MLIYKNRYVILILILKDKNLKRIFFNHQFDYLEAISLDNS